jgi:hypothetical protein
VTGVSVIDQFAQTLSGLRALGVEPDTMRVGREFALALHAEIAGDLRPGQSLPEFLRSIEAGTAYLNGIRLEAGWEVSQRRAMYGDDQRAVSSTPAAGERGAVSRRPGWSPPR